MKSQKKETENPAESYKTRTTKKCLKVERDLGGVFVQ